MRVAVCISGQVRYSAHIWENLRENLIKPNDADVYCAFWDEPQAKFALDIFRPKKYQLIPLDKFKTLKIEFYNKYLSLAKKVIPTEEWNEFIQNRNSYINGKTISHKGISVNRDNVLRMFYMMYLANSLVEDQYDYVVRVRPDIFFDEPVIIKSLETNVVFNNQDRKKRSKADKFQWCSDRFFYSSPENMAKILDWENLPKQIVDSWDIGYLKNHEGHWFHPETTLWAIKQNLGLQVEPLITEAYNYFFTRKYIPELILIAHRGNISGRVLESENKPEYLENAIKQGYHVECDVWNVDGKFYLGHDKAMYPVSDEFFLRKNVWAHAKDRKSLQQLQLIKAPHVFWHENDFCTFTSDGYCWTADKRMLKCITPKTIYVEKELLTQEEIYSGIMGVCSDDIKRIRETPDNYTRKHAPAVEITI